METGEQWPSREQVEAWTRCTKADDRVTARLIAMVEALYGATWSAALAAEPVPHLQGLAARRDEDARLIRVWFPLLIPALLQTAAYARAVISDMDPTGEMDVAAAAAARIERQRILYEGGRRFEFLIGEPALLWSPAEEVLPGQLDRLAALAGLKDVAVGIVRSFRVGMPGWHDFVYREPADGSPAYVTSELIWAGPQTDDPTSVAQVGKVWEQLWASAAHGDEALSLIRERGTST